MGRPKRGSGEVEQAHLDTDVVRLRSQRLTFQAIADQQGCSTSTAYARFRRGLAAIPYEAVEELRRAELESLDEQERRFLAVQEREHLKIDHGKVIEIDGSPVLDDAPVVQAGLAILRIKDMRAKLTGEYAPVKVEQKIEHTTAADAELERLAQLLASRADEASAMAGGSTA